MKCRVGIFLLFALLLPTAAPTLFSQESGIQTNAQSGVFASDRRFWFSVPAGQRLRLAVNGNETYRGPGPASATLSVKPSEDKSFELTVERRSAPPEDVLLESKVFLARIDTVPPEKPAVSAIVAENGDPAWTLSFAAEPGARVHAALEVDSSVRLYEDAPASLRVAGKRISGLAWCLDEAGNSSEAVDFAFEPFSLDIANPVPGTWANRQLLIVESEGAADIRWSDDGSDPFGAGGKVYQGPALIDKTGIVHLKVAAKSADGRLERREALYRVAESAEIADSLSALRAAEMNGVPEGIRVAVPAGFVWDIGDAGRSAIASGSRPRFDGGTSVEFRAVAGVVRTVPLYLDGGQGVHRFAFVLGRSGEATSATVSAKNIDTPHAGPEFRTVGRVRVVAWGYRPNGIRYRWDSNAPWREASGPQPVPALGGRLEWVAEKGSTVEGPFSLQVPAVADEASFPSVTPGVEGALPSARGIVVRAPRGGARFSLSAKEIGLDARTLELAGEQALTLDVCDGEQFSWSLSGDAGAPLVLTLDRRKPAPPLILGPAEASWTRDASRIGLSAADGTVVASATWRREDGLSGSLAVADGDRLTGSREGPVEYSIQAYAVDEAGNRSPLVKRSFIIDEATVYVSAAASPSSVSTARDGSRAAPFASLDEALRFARAEGRTRIQLSATAELRGPVALFDGVVVEGGYDAQWRKSALPTKVRAAPGGAFILREGRARLGAFEVLETAARGVSLFSVEGSNLELRAIAVDSSFARAASVPTLVLSQMARLDAKDCVFYGGSPVLALEDSSAILHECLLSGERSVGGKIAAIRSIRAELTIEASRIAVSVPQGANTATANAIGIEMNGGFLRANRSVISVEASDSATAVALRDTRAEVVEVDCSATASVFATALSRSGGTLSWRGGALRASAHDAASVVDNAATAGRIEGTAVVVAGAGVLRGVQALGAFPVISDCSFQADGASSASDAFAGEAPAPGSIRNTSFSGFRYLLDRVFDADSIAAFNRRFAGGGPANRVQALR